MAFDSPRTPETADSLAGDPASAALRHWLEPLRPFLDADGVSELCINGPGEMFIESHKGWEQIAMPIICHEYCSSLARLIATYTVQRLDEKNNILSAPLPTGERCQVVIPPSCEPGRISITIRKPSKTEKTLDQLAGEGTFSGTVAYSEELNDGEKELLRLHRGGHWTEFYRMAVQLKKNMVISGATGSGKTTFTRSLIGEIPRDERIITIEDTPELPLPQHPNHVHLLYSKDGQGVSTTTPKSLLESCLRMKPDRILLAELRGSEAYYYLRNVASGHPGSITTIHSDSARMAFVSLRLLVKETPHIALETDDINMLLYTLIDVVVQMKHRKVTEVYYDPMKKRQGLA